jgi:hypothetical protein
MDLALVFGALMLGLAGTPHCAAMCGPSCALVLRRAAGPGSTGAARVTWTFHAARLAGYATAGALAAAGVGLLAAAGSAAPWLRPLWTLLHIAAMALGLWLLFTGRQPAWMSGAGTVRRGVVHVSAGAPGGAAGWQPMIGIGSAAAAGAAWVAWPCGLLQSALVVSGLANTPASGAAAMAAFALGSAAGLQLAPALLAQLSSHGGSRIAVVAVRLAGGALAAGSFWAIGHDVVARVVAYCVS